MRADGGISDAQMVGDTEAAVKWMRAQPDCNGRVGLIGSCSGGRHALLTASRVRGFDAVADLWGGGVIAAQEELSPARPVAVIGYTADLSAPPPVRQSG